MEAGSLRARFPGTGQEGTAERSAGGDSLGYHAERVWPETRTPSSLRSMIYTPLLPPLTFEGDSASTSASAARESLRTWVEAALPIARGRAQLISRMRAALESGDDQTALALAREVAGLL